ncbi:MAG: DEAD/DEAH box helicase [Propionicimonas sp.]
MSGFDSLYPVVQHHVVNTLAWKELRPLQESAIDPILRGDDALLLAPTAGGKTEAAIFPVLTKMAAADWRGTTVLYICPLRALLNNLEHRVAGYARWVGRSAAVRHGDTGQTARRRQVVERPDFLLTTPESLESILVSATIDPQVVLADVRAVIIDEVHAFAGDDRGWHLLAVLERITRIADRPLQRIGLSATVGNPDQLLAWLQGSNRASRPATVVAPVSSAASDADLELDYVGSIDNAATVISQLHQGEKRLVFADSRKTVESLAVRLRGRGVETYVSHSSLSASERRRAEQAFAEARNCVITATSTLELGIDVGDLDRVIQIGAPGTAASLLQRLGRTGRRPGTQRNMLFLATKDEELLQAAALGLLWSEGYVEPIHPTPSPNHIAAQQILALTLQEGHLGRQMWPEWLAGVDLTDSETADQIVDFLVTTGHLDSDTDMLFIGPQAEQTYGRRHFMELMSVFTSAPEFTIFHGRDEIGTVDPMVLVAKIDGPRIILLAGDAWKVTGIDWQHHRAWVERSDQLGKVQWFSSPPPLSFAVTDAIRRLLLGADPAGVQLSHRATSRLDDLRTQWEPFVDADHSVIFRDENGLSWWTWAGRRANATLHAALLEVSPHVVGDQRGVDNYQIPLGSQISASDLTAAHDAVIVRLGADLSTLSPEVNPQAIDELKFSDLLPRDLATSTLASRLQDHRSASLVLRRMRVVREIS